MVSWSVSKDISSTSRTMTGHLPVLIEALSAFTTDSGILRSLLGIRNHSHFIPLIIFIPISSLAPSVCCPGLPSLIGITSSYELKPSSWSVNNWLFGSVCIVPLMETKSLLHWANQMKMCFLPCIFSLKCLALFLSGVVIFAETCKG